MESESEAWSSPTVMPIGSIGMQHLGRCATEVGKGFFPFVRPCFTPDAAGLLVSMGTCFLLKLHGRRYLLTAAHVADDAVSSGMYVAAGEKLALVAGDFFATIKKGGARANDHYDFAFLELSDAQCLELNADSFITEDMISHNKANRTGRFYMTFGFPDVMQPQNYEYRKFFTQAWAYVGTDEPHSQMFGELGVSGKDHFCIRYQERVRFFDGGEGGAPDPVGASGGVLIDLGKISPDHLHLDAPCRGMVAGLLIEHQRPYQRILAVDIRLVMESINEVASIAQ
jgi:hypothetical protein